MSEVKFIKNLLAHEWESSITGRATDVPKPAFTLEKRKSNAGIRNQDVGYVASGGDTNYTPLGLGWTHQTVDTVVAIEYRAATRTVPNSYDDGYNRVLGKPTGANGLGAPDRWDGITGETARILLDNRNGRGGWDLVGADTLRVVDNIDTGGKNYYRADVVVGLQNLADEIDTST